MEKNDVQNSEHIIYDDFHTKMMIFALEIVQISAFFEF